VSDINFDQAVVTLHHKRDVDEYEDGCIARVEINFTHASGCLLRLAAGERLSPSGGLEILSMEFTADSLCPGFPDSTEGTYLAQGGLEQGEVLLSVMEVPGSNVETSCVVTSLVVRMRGLVFRDSDGEMLVVDQTEMVINGGFISSGDFNLSCPCLADCAGKTCGPDGCNGSCGQCQDGQACEDGLCSCVPDCSNRECGPDGCGGSCGTCQPHESCDYGHCYCLPDCYGKECGSDGCGGSCGTCDPDETCVNGYCNCQPDCYGKECGSDGCGGSCGYCSGGQVCEDYTCVGWPDYQCSTTDVTEIYDNCLGVPYEGCCDGYDNIVWCSGSKLVCLACDYSAPCGWVDEGVGYNCGGSGADPSGTFPISCSDY
jgi:hypothetical protein